MTKKKQNIIIPLVLVCIVVGVYLYVKKESSANSLPPSKLPVRQPTVAPQPKPTTAAAVATTAQAFPLKVGSNNANVKQLQDALGVTIDGIFGKDTLAALQDQTGYSQVNSYDDLQFICEGIFLVDNDFATQAQMFPVMINAEDFVTAWYNAANDGLDTFTYQGILYNSQGGVQTIANLPVPSITGS